ncbi:rcsF protein [Colwellia echini]|uniref:RcsF protein n=1 Tax=Colwellia echini TaxID=1982103 RepID=A0ABY3N0C9_9GAMM|nr:rcsF protein [Colwellia echini]
MLLCAVTISVITTLISSCSGNYAFNSNVKPDNADQYFSASNVKIYNNIKEFPGPFELVGLVEGDDCQTKAHLAPPDPINARTQARQSAYAQKANAVIFTSCINIDAQHCVAQIVCYGKAYKVVTSNE